MNKFMLLNVTTLRRFFEVFQCGINFFCTWKIFQSKTLGFRVVYFFHAYTPLENNRHFEFENFQNDFL